MDILNVGYVVIRDRIRSEAMTRYGSNYTLVIKDFNCFYIV